MQQVEARRPLKARDWKSIQAGARWLNRQGATPNQISIASVVFAGIAGLCMTGFSSATGASLWLSAFGAAFFVLCRALCNVFDGLVAIEGGKKTRSGELFNDIPDRIADSLILVCAGYGAAVTAYAPEFGWCAALLAVSTAYIRTLARSIGAPPDFRGPMAKVHRMALISGACLLTPLESLIVPQGTLLVLALIAIILGCLITIWARAYAAYRYLESAPDA